MFGYVKIDKPEIKMKEYELYRGIYCSLCKSLGKNYGLLSRFFLNYDFTFLAICRMATEKKSPAFKKSHCTFCISKKCMCCETDNDCLSYSSAITIMSVYYKILDNISDGNLFKKIIMKMVYPYINHKMKKAKKKYPEIAEIFEKNMPLQALCEKENVSSIDRAADNTAKTLGSIMSFGYDSSEYEAAYRFGYFLGRFIYISDALDDLDKDKKSRNYNPFLLNNADIGVAEIRNNSEELLNITADEMAKSYELLNYNRFKSVLDNIIYYGIDNTISTVLRKENAENEKSL